MHLDSPFAPPHLTADQMSRKWSFVTHISIPIRKSYNMKLNNSIFVACMG